MRSARRRARNAPCPLFSYGSWLLRAFIRHILLVIITIIIRLLFLILLILDGAWDGDDASQ